MSFNTSLYIYINIYIIHRHDFSTKASDPFRKNEKTTGKEGHNFSKRKAFLKKREVK